MLRVTESVVVDTNVFVAALKSKEGASRQVLRLCLQSRLSPLVGQKLLLELEDVLQRPGLLDGSPATQEDRQALLRGFLSTCRWVNIFYLWRPNLPDEGDNHILELALAGGADLIITHNVRDFFGELKFPGLRIVTPAQCLKLMR